VYATSAHTRRALGAVVAQACSDPPERGELPYQLLWTERIDQLPALVTLPSAVARELGALVAMTAAKFSRDLAGHNLLPGYRRRTTCPGQRPTRFRSHTQAIRSMTKPPYCL